MSHGMVILIAGLLSCIVVLLFYAMALLEKNSDLQRFLEYSKKDLENMRILYSKGFKK